MAIYPNIFGKVLCGSSVKDQFQRKTKKRQKVKLRLWDGKRRRGKTDTVTLTEEPAGGTLENRRRTSREGDWNRDGATHHCGHARDWHGPELMRLERASVFTAKSPREQLLISRDTATVRPLLLLRLVSSLLLQRRSAAALCRPRAPANRLRRPRDQDGLRLGRPHSC